jgi:peptidyl-dipeptidase A
MEDKKMNKKFLGCVLASFLSTTVSAKTSIADNEKQIKEFIQSYETKVEPAYKKVAITGFDAQISGKENDYKKSSQAQVDLSKIFSNKEDYAVIKKLRKLKVADKDLKRQIELIYNAYTSNQISPEKLEATIKLQTEIENKFNIFRPDVDGKKLTDNEVEKILKTSNSSIEVEKTWKASKAIGKTVSEDVKKLVLMRNQAAKELGFKNYHQMMLKLSEQDPKQIEKLFNELDALTRPAFASLKKDIDKALAKKFNVPVSKLQPWHYQNRFFQEAPEIYELDLDGYYKDKDLVKLTETYYAGMGMPVDDIAERSDLYEKKGKYQHACENNIDRKQDIRIICNIKPNASWMDTTLHEFGHGIYDKYLDQSMPWTFREAAHTFTTEAIAQLFGRMSSNPVWLHDVVGISKEEQTKIADMSFKIQRLRQLVFSRWVQVMYRFEKGMYENPNQDLNALWWRLVEKYQLVKKPAGRNEPDWSSKIHVALYPAYYHNYLMGELLASQLNAYVVKNVIRSKDLKNQSYARNKEVGKYFIDNVFAPGRKFYWNDMIQKATGEKLTAKHYAKQFVN